MTLSESTPIIRDCILVSTATIGINVALGEVLITDCEIFATTNIFVDDASTAYVDDVQNVTYDTAGSGAVEPVSGDRAVWDALGFAARHANDIDEATGIHHTLAGLLADGLISGTGTPGLIPQWDTASTLEDSNLSKVGAGDIVLSAPTNVAVTIDASLEIDPTGAIDGDLLGYDGAHWVATEPNPNASTTKYRAKTSATSGDPASRYILWNNATQASATELNISNINDYSRDVTVFLGLIQVDDIIILQRESVAGSRQRWIVSGAPVDNGTYWTIPVTLDDSSYSFTNNEVIFLVWVGSTGGGGGVVTEGDLLLSDVTTWDVDTTQHGFAPKSPGDGSVYLDGNGNYSTPASSTVFDHVLASSYSLMLGG